jgi:cytochrome oxidase assembly protein ShyY1
VFSVVRQPRWIGLALVAILIAALCLLAARWQWHRREARLAHNAIVTSHLQADPVVPQRVLAVDQPLAATAEYTLVTMAGTWDVQHEVLVRNHLGRAGYDVITPFVPDTGPALLVDRGWIAPSNAGAGTAPTIPQPTSGGSDTVTVVARLRLSEPPRGAAGLPTGQVYAIDAPTIAAGLPYPAYGAYGELVSQDPPPPPGLTLPDAPDLGTGTHLIYAIQWTCFALIALIGYVVLVRREVIERRGRVSAEQPVPTA